MPGTKRPRRQHRARPKEVPMTSGFTDSVEATLLGAALDIATGRLDPETLSGLCTITKVLLQANEMYGHRDGCLLVRSMGLTLGHVIDRAERTRQLTYTDLDRASIANGIEAARRMIRAFTMRQLADAWLLTRLPLVPPIQRSDA